MHDIIVIGAGPAGLAAATTAASAGSSVLLLDAAARPGGQYWRHRAGGTGRGHRDWPVFRRLLARLGQVECRFGAQVWFVEPGFAVHTSDGAWPARRLVIATGAYDRTIPFPGWDLPGVVTAGAAQALLKGQGVTVGERVVVAGTGPFLLPVAVGLADAGVTVPGVFEANHPLGYLRYGSALPKLPEAFGYAVRLARHRIGYHTRHTIVAAHGRQRLEAVSIAGPTIRQIECDTLAIGYGFTPQVELAVALGCHTTLDADTNLVVTETGQRTNVDGVFVAGEVTGVGGAALALLEGRIAGLAAAGLDIPKRLLGRRDALRRFAAVMAAVHRVPPISCDQDTIVCRCENTTAGQIRQAVAELGVVDTRGVKLMTRAGMGWCQGRVCGYPTACLTARALQRQTIATDLRTFANRPIAQPISLSQLASGDRK